jgi:hypothetical protein
MCKDCLIIPGKLSIGESEVISTSITKISRMQNEEGESLLGDLVADSQRDAMNTDIALVTSGELPVPFMQIFRQGTSLGLILRRVLPRMPLWLGNMEDGTVVHGLQFVS